MISTKNKRVLSIYRVTIVDQIVTENRLEKLKLVQVREHRTSSVEVTAHFCTVNHQSGVLSFWAKPETRGNNEYERVRIFPMSTWVGFEKIRDLDE